MRPIKDSLSCLDSFYCVSWFGNRKNEATDTGTAISEWWHRQWSGSSRDNCREANLKKGESNSSLTVGGETEHLKHDEERRKKSGKNGERIECWGWRRIKNKLPEAREEQAQAWSPKKLYYQGHLVKSFRDQAEWCNRNHCWELIHIFSSSTKELLHCLLLRVQEYDT